MTSPERSSGRWSHLLLVELPSSLMPCRRLKLLVLELSQRWRRGGGRETRCQKKAVLLSLLLSLLLGRRQVNSKELSLLLRLLLRRTLCALRPSPRGAVLLSLRAAVWSRRIWRG